MSTLPPLQAFPLGRAVGGLCGSGTREILILNLMSNLDLYLKIVTRKSWPTLTLDFLLSKMNLCENLFQIPDGDNYIMMNCLFLFDISRVKVC